MSDPHTPDDLDSLPGRVEDAIYSPDSVLVNGQWRRQTWQQLAEERDAEITRLRKFERLVLDLDRNEGGRHEGDADVGDPSGVSQGNFRGIRTGDVIGHSLGGHPYRMPERGKRHDPDAWISR